MFGKGGMGDLMKQAQQMQEKMAEAQRQLAEAEHVGQAGAGLVEIVMTGRHDVKRVTIDDSLMSEDKEMLEDLLAAAVNDAVRRVEASSKDLMKDVAGGVDIPDGFKMPF
nr:YbaB/EbfC family nucleoid-associated protein [Sinobacterium caligoides]